MNIREELSKIELKPVVLISCKDEKYLSDVLEWLRYPMYRFRTYEHYTDMRESLMKFYTTERRFCMIAQWYEQIELCADVFGDDMMFIRIEEDKIYAYEYKTIIGAIELDIELR